MKIIKPGFEFITPINGGVILKRLEDCGRVCYKSEGKITDDSAPKFVAGIIKRGHEVVMTANIREWRHFLRLRTSTGAHPQIREIATPLLRELQQIVPVCFDDILPKEADHETS